MVLHEADKASKHINQFLMKYVAGGIFMSVIFLPMMNVLYLLIVYGHVDQELLFRPHRFTLVIAMTMDNFE